MEQKAPQQLEEGKAAFAFEAVKKNVEDNKVPSSNFSSYIKKMPSMIQVNGLGQTLAFYYSKSSSSGDGLAYKRIYETLSEWLEQKYPAYFKEHPELVQAVINVDSFDYRLMTVEIMSLLNWMKKFVSGMVKSVGEVS